ncbi:uncharacterized protein LOC120429062 [Culex pipiens pallens]|uniref:uncharacterized protein LOC120429062 n=1 Tax=Culex pipiens pallens TaxID=42434 RepID=UPI0022AAF286|nr:uncharacterized protein LOC120429062 [Culex pipiens pallens]
MFCSPECAKLAQQRYHRFECPVLRGLYTLDEIGRMDSPQSLRSTTTWTPLANTSTAKVFIRSCSTGQQSPPCANGWNQLAVLGAYPLASMINHGCSANVMPVGLPGDRVAIVATRQIAPGEQIFEAY